MTESEKKEILKKSKKIFQDEIIQHHISGIEKLGQLSTYDCNPFTVPYLANCVFGETSSENMAKVLIYSRLLGTSIATIFGNGMQFYCNTALHSFASQVSGIDIEFDDAIDKRHKYCQVKAGPQTINKDDVKTIKDHFTAIKNLARTNRNHELNPMTDCIVGVIYGTDDSISGNYRKIKEEYPVYVGKEFWHRLTGDPKFYSSLIKVFEEAGRDSDCTDKIKEVISQLTTDIEENYRNIYS